MIRKQNINDKDYVHCYIFSLNIFKSYDMGKNPFGCPFYYVLLFGHSMYVVHLRLQLYIYYLISDFAIEYFYLM